MGFIINPIQKIYLDQVNLSKFLIDLVSLYTLSRIPISSKLPMAKKTKYIRVITGTSKLTGAIRTQYGNLKDLQVWSPNDAGALKTNSILKVLFGFRRLDPTGWFSQLPTSQSYLYTYLNLWKGSEFWTINVDKGSGEYGLLNTLAQDLLMEYFQSGLYVKKDIVSRLRFI